MPRPIPFSDKLHLYRVTIEKATEDEAVNMLKEVVIDGKDANLTSKDGKFIYEYQLKSKFNSSTMIEVKYKTLTLEYGSYNTTAAQQVPVAVEKKQPKLSYPHPN